MTNEEKRKFARIDSLHLLNYVFTENAGDGKTQGMGRTLNVSEAGIRLETHTPIPVGSTIFLTIGFEEEMVVDIKGRVIYTKKNENGMNESGIEFLDMDQAAREILKRYITAFNSRQT